MSEVTFSNSNFSQKVMLAERWFRGTGVHDAAEKMYDGAAGAVDSIQNAGSKLYRENFGPSESKQSNPQGKAVQESMRARFHNNPGMLPGGPQSNAFCPQDTMAFSPEALALMG